MPHRTGLLLLLVHAAALLLVHGVRKKASGRSRACTDLPEEVLEQMFGSLSVGVMSAFHHALQLEPRDARNLSCPAAARAAAAAADGKTHVPANLLSVSPWAYRMSYDAGRYPRYVPEAYCLCTGCLLGAHGEESQRHRSAPVLAPAVILRRTGSCAGGRHAYAEVYVSVAVGCTCVPRDGRGYDLSLDGGGAKARRLPTGRKKV
ncbi:unnamed protein product [Ophioblennius macclurei]